MQRQIDSTIASVMHLNWKHVMNNHGTKAATEGQLKTGTSMNYELANGLVAQTCTYSNSRKPQLLLTCAAGLPPLTLSSTKAFLSGSTRAQHSVKQDGLKF